MNHAPSAWQYVLSGLFLMLVGWGGLALLIFVFLVPPLVWARWGFFALWFCALAGTAKASATSHSKPVFRIVSSVPMTGYRDARGFRMWCEGGRFYLRI